MDRSCVINLIDNIQKVYTTKAKECPSQHLGYTLDWEKDSSVYFQQADFASKILYDFNMHESNPVRAPAPMNLHQIVESESLEFPKKIYRMVIGMLNYLWHVKLPSVTQSS